MSNRKKSWFGMLVMVIFLCGTIFFGGMKVSATGLENEEVDSYDMLSASRGKVTKVFTDVKAGEWYVDAIQFVYDRKIMNGVSDNTFGPNGVLTREQFITVLYNLEGTPKITFKKYFNDVTDEKSWYAKAVTWAAKNKITSGVGDNKFGTGMEITREQLATLLYNYAQKKDEYKLSIDKKAVANFPDAKKIDSWASEGMKWAITNGVMNGKKGKDGQLFLDPLGKATRAECAQMIKNLKEKAVKNNDQPHVLEVESSRLEKLIKEAVAQYNKEDYTNLAEPVQYNVLWIGYTHVVYGDLDYRMTDFDKEYLKAVALNYEKSVESITNHNLDISVDLYFCNDKTALTIDDEEGFFFIGTDTVRPLINSYSAKTKKQYDMVFTTIQTAGEDNYNRNKSKADYGKYYAILGFTLSDISSGIGHASFDLGLPGEGTYPLADPAVPSLYATAVAVHEWMHTLEPLGGMLGIEYPNTHAYMGPKEFPGYKQYIADANDYDFFEFYKLVLTGKAPYTGDGKVKHVGMYPKMWPLVKNGAFSLGNYTIQDANGNAYLTGQEEQPTLTLTNKPCVWNVYCVGIGKYALILQDLQDRRIDLSNAWDEEGNTIGIWYNTGYVDAQSWRLVPNGDGSFMIQTNYESGRVLTVKTGENATLNSIGSSGVQKWKFNIIR